MTTCSESYDLKLYISMAEVFSWARQPNYRKVLTSHIG